MAVPLKMTREQHSLTVAMDQTTVQKCVGSQICKMIAWMSQNKPFYKRRKKLIPPPRPGASFRAKKNYVDAHMALIIIMVALSITVV